MQRENQMTLDLDALAKLCEMTRTKVNESLLNWSSTGLLELAEGGLALIARCRELEVPYCLGRGTIERLAADGQCILAGRAFIAASDLHRKDPYALLEQAEARATGLRDALTSLLATLDEDDSTVDTWEKMVLARQALATPSPASRIGERLVIAERTMHAAWRLHDCAFPDSCEICTGVVAWRLACSEADRE